MNKGIVGVEEFTALTELMKTNQADKIRAGMLFVLDRGRR